MKHKSSDYKLQAVKYYINNNSSLSKTCEIFKCSERSLKRWIDRFNETGNVDNKNRKEGSYKIRQRHVKFILTTIKNNPLITLNLLLELFHKKYKNIKLSRTHLSNIIKYSNLTYKKVQITHKPKTRYNKIINYKDEYKRFYSKIKKYKLKNIIAIDETSINVGLHKIRGREIIGKRLNKITTDNKVFMKYTLIMAISPRKIVRWKLYKIGGSNHQRLIKFLSKITKHRKKRLILMDNASCHRNELVKKFIKKSQNDYVYILPYNHWNNPIEKCFYQLKTYIRRDEPMSYKEIKKSIKKAIKNITKDNLYNYFKSSLIKRDKKDINITKFMRKSKIYKK